MSEHQSPTYVSSKSFGYRPDIEGLRAIAVLLVLFYHSGIGTISGGFIGVDIFFVISGFLITKIIHKEILSNSFTFASFYARRLMRIYPMLIVVIATTTLACYHILAPADFIFYIKSTLSSLASVSNFLFWNSEGGYFAQSADQIPLIHTWSLSIEEQFYILMPATLILSIKYLAPRGRTVTFHALFFLSFFYSVWSTYNDQASSYYLLTSRAFELMIGAGLAFSWDRIPSFGVVSSNVMRISSLVVIVASALLINSKTHFPGLAAVSPCFAAAMLIASGKRSSPKNIDSYALIANPVMTYIGKISYSLYLWHWPVIALVNYQGIPIDASMTAKIIVVSFALSSLSFHFIESPIRKRKTPNFKTCLAVTFAAPVLASVLGLTFTVMMEGFNGRLSAELQEEFSQRNSPGAVYKDCFNSYRLDNFDSCYIGSASSSVYGMFLGDSMAAHYTPFMDVLARDAGIKLIGTSSSGLPPFHVKNYKYFKNQRTDQALFYNESRIKMSMSYKAVFIAASWAQGYPYLSENEDNLFSSIERYISNGMSVYLIARPNTITDEIVNTTRTKRMSGENISSIRAPFKDSNQFLRKIRDKFPKVIIIDPNPIICHGNSCIVSIDNKTMYLDSAHINIHASKKLAELYLKQFGNPIKQTN